MRPRVRNPRTPRKLAAPFSLAQFRDDVVGQQEQLRRIADTRGQDAATNRLPRDADKQ